VIERARCQLQTGEQLKRALNGLCPNAKTKFRVASIPILCAKGRSAGFLPSRTGLYWVEERRAEQELRELYRRFLKELSAARCISELSSRCDTGFVVTTIASAELIKHASNSFWD